ncbi:MAG: lipoprotein [Burkholderiales bacterium]|nr:lipoprotein [Burkholderiales bacterium]
MRASPLIVVVLCLALALLAGCGQKGPLKLPEPAPAAQPATPPAKATGAASPSTSSERK